MQQFQPSCPIAGRCPSVKTRIGVVRPHDAPTAVASTVAAATKGLSASQDTAAIALATAPMLCSFSAATQMRPESMP